MKKNIIITIILSLLFKITFSSVIYGKITNKNNEPLAFASVYIKNNTYGVATDYKGKYFLELKPGKYTLVYSYIGYKSIEKDVVITKNSRKEINVILEKKSTTLREIEVVANKEDKAKRIIDNVRKNRKKYLKSYTNYKYESYYKTSIEEEKTIYNDTLYKNKEKATDENFSDYLSKQGLNFIEALSDIYFSQPSKYKEVIKAYNDYTKPDEPLGKSVSIGVEIGEDDIKPENLGGKTNRYIFYNDISKTNFNFYKNLINIPSISDQPLKSPVAQTSGLNYKFEYLGSFYENNKKINKIKVIPRNKVEPLFKGIIFIEDSTWAIISVDFEVNKKALKKYKNFRIIQNYKQIKQDVYLPNRIEFFYTIKKGKSNILGNTKISNSKFVVDTILPKGFFNNQIKSFEVDALDKDSVYWKQIRPIELKEKEIKFISKTDSVIKYYSSDKFLDRQDSIYNHINWWSILAGVGYSNHYSGIKVYLGGIMSQIVPFGVGGYRHKLPVSLNKEFKNNMLLETQEELDYGFLNNDVKGKLTVGLTYYPKKFIKTSVTIGNFYSLINNYASIEQTFSRSNYVNEKSFGIAQRMEIFNGLFAKLSFEYSDQLPITDIKLAKWSDFIFGDLNKPVDFNRYTKTECDLLLKYVIGQKYYIKKNKKVVIGNNYPIIKLKYRKGFPNFLNSEVNFDYFEISANADIKLAKFGLSRWRASFGTFLNKTNLRLLEYKYFRGSDIYFFSDPLLSFQLLGPTLNTTNEFLQANYIHHFNGSILNRIPFFRYLQLSLAGGAGNLSIPRDKFAHFEMFAGVEKKFRIKTQLFRLGIYGVTSENTITKKPEITIKFGISDYSDYTEKWSY